SLLGNRDLRVWQEYAHDVRQLAETHGDPARAVESVARGVGPQHAGEHLGDVLHVNQETHEPFLGKVHRLAARGLRHDLHVVHRATNLVGTGDVGRTHARDRHAVVLDVLARLELVEELVHRVLARAVRLVTVLPVTVTGRT